MKRIVLYIPSRIYGGAERQMALLAKLAADGGFDVTVIDSKVGVVANLVRSRKEINILTEEVGAPPLKIRDSIVITQASYAFCLDSMLKLVNCDIRFWFMHQLNVPQMFLYNKLPKLLRKSFSGIYSPRYKKELAKFSGSFYFMAEDIKDSVESFYGITFENEYTGLLSDRRSYLEMNKHEEGTKKSICWLGRLDKSSKFFAVKKLLREFKEAESKSTLDEFVVIGDGDAKNALMDYANSLALDCKVKFVGHVNYEELTQVISKSCVLFAQGTSVYEGVYSRVPVALVDFYVKDEHIQEMNYELYSEAKGQGLGNLIISGNDSRITDGYSFEQLITKAQKDNVDLTSKQVDKLERLINTGEARCKSMFSEKRDDFSKPRNFALDTYFFKFRKIFIKLRSRLV